MELKDIALEIVDYIATIDYTHTASSVSLFETNIRYLAGMLAGYDLLTGPLAHWNVDSAKTAALLSQSKKLADTLKFAFDTATGIPWNDLDIVKKGYYGDGSNGLATIGSLVLEWTHLSDLTGDPQYAALTQRAEMYLLQPQPPSGQPFPGLVGTNINISTGLFLDAAGGWSGGDDSFYEYLIKMYVYDPNRFGIYKDRWIAAADSTMQHLASRPSSRKDLTFLAQFNGQNLNFNSQHLTCFDGGNFLLGGLVLNREDYKAFGLALTAGCHATYTATATSIGPEQFSWVVDKGAEARSVPQAQAAFYAKNGFWITSSPYILRPEVVESYYYAYRITGNGGYKNWAWDAFMALNNTCRTPSGYTAVRDVNAPHGGAPLDDQESFFFAEVMKYMYLIHSPDNQWQVNHNGQNDFVFNTEAHPFKVWGKR
jgi:mannosyl-oligosaccharide alpha-1,2-mannosidase